MSLGGDILLMAGDDNGVTTPLGHVGMGNLGGPDDPGAVNGDDDALRFDLVVRRRADPSGDLLTPPPVELGLIARGLQARPVVR